MSRLSREQKRELKRQRSAGAVPGGQQAAGVTPIEVHVPTPTAGAAGGATVGGMPVVAAPGETVQAAVLNYLHRLALATGHPVLATIHDELIGFVVPLQVYVDGSSRYAGEPVRVGAGTGTGTSTVGSTGEGQPQPQPRRQVQQPQPPAPPSAPVPQAPVSGARAQEEPAPGAPAAPETPPVPRRDKATYVLRAVPEPTIAPAPAPAARPEPAPAPAPAARPEPAPAPAPAARPEPAPAPAPTPEPEPVQTPTPTPTPTPEPERPAASAVPAPDPVRPPTPPPTPTPTPSTFVLRAVPEPKPLPGAAATHVLRAVPESAAGVVTAPTGEFGPAPVAEPAPVRKSVPAMEAMSLMEPEPEPKPAPVRGFDAVAEAVLAPSPAPEGEGEGAAAFLVEPVARINEAVKMGRIEAAAGMAERAVAEAAQALGEEHQEVLKLRELTAYIAYLAGDALRSFHLSLDLARVRRRHRDPRAAYGNVQSAAAAWRAVRDPLQGLHLGRDLIGVWTELTADGGPAADDIEQLESARTRMGRLTERARVLADNPYTQSPRAHGQ
ncbi:hypothetical protein [Streptomyces lutosisoli]|uniref:Tetratricopeptide repeat protein n=1 Tax=Streptomyces lutosisoli TaxID=2665721 RepID=A0ABW2VDZ4_9ACTN